MIASFKNMKGYKKIYHPLVLVALLIATVILGFFIGKGGIKIAMVCLALFPALIYINRFFNHPQIGIYSILIMGFLAIGISRYVPNVPFGLSIDGLLVLTYIAVYFRNFYSEVNWQYINRDLTYLMIIWFMYSVAQLFNPEALSRTAWFYAMRGMSLYSLLLIPLCFMIFNRLRYMMVFLYIYAFFSIMASLKGMQQIYIGLDSAEQFWIDTVGGITHVLFGELRAFSFMSDAGQFGAAQGAAGVVGILIAMNIRGFINKGLFYTMGFLGLWGMMISGTRGAIIVPLLGFATYIVHRKNVRVLFFGGIFLALTYVFFAHTYIGQNNSQIRRMRTAFRPEEDASYLVRLENRRILSGYLATRPFGGGIGSAGDWGQRFSPQGFLAQVATDSWYVQIWAEQGIIGLILHLIILCYIVLKGSFIIMFRLQHQELRGIVSALMGGFVGIIGASYGNGVLGQNPTGIILYISWGFFMMATQLEREYVYLTEKKKNPWSLTTSN